MARPDHASRDKLSLLVPPPPPLPLASNAGDLELRLLQAFSEYAGHGIVRSYAYIKHSSRLLGFVASSTETVVTKAGLVAIVRFFYDQYMKLGHPLVRSVDEEVGRRVVMTFVRLLLAVEYQQHEQPRGRLTAHGESLELTYYERLQALLYGQVPRLQTLILELQMREEDAKHQPPAFAFNPEDYVEKDKFQRLQEESNKAMMEKEQEVEVLKDRVHAAEAARRQLELDSSNAEANQKAESSNTLTEMEGRIAALQKQVLAAESAREHLVQELQSAQEQHQNEQDKLIEEKKVEVASLRKEAEITQRAREQLLANLREALTLKDNESRDALTAKEEEVATLKNEIQAAELARKQLEQDLEATRIRLESEHSQRVKELEEEVARAKREASEKDHDERANSLRQQRTSFNANLVKDYVHQAMPERMQIKSPAASNNQDDHDSFGFKSDSARSPLSSTSSVNSASSPRMTDDDKKKAKREKEKLNARMRRVLGSRF